MSGGPVFGLDEDGNFYVCAMIVAGSDEPVAAGIRAFDAKVAAFIRTYLR